MSLDQALIHVLCRDTRYRIERLSRAVQEGQHLDEAADFARYVLNSVAPLLAANPQPEPLPCDGHLLRHYAQDLLSLVQDRWRTHDTKPKLQLSELEAINHKLDLIAGRLAAVGVGELASQRGRVADEVGDPPRIGLLLPAQFISGELWDEDGREVKHG